MKFKTFVLMLVTLAVGILIGSRHNAKTHTNVIERTDTIYRPSEIRYVLKPTSENRIVRPYNKPSYETYVDSTKAVSDGKEMGKTELYCIEYTDTVKAENNDSLIASYNAHITSRDSTTTLDSISLTILNIPQVTITKEVTKIKRNHFNYGITVGCGYGLFNKKADVFVGMGITYSF